jgi:hypothetical protein
LKAVDSRRVLDSLSLQLSDSEQEDHNSDDHDESTSTIAHFNEKMVRVICLNQAIDKYQRELSILKNERDMAIDKL